MAARDEMWAGSLPGIPPLPLLWLMSGTALPRALWTRTITESVNSLHTYGYQLFATDH